MTSANIVTVPPRPHLSQRTLQAVPTGPKAATLLSLQCVTLRGQEPRPEGLGHLPCRVPGAPKTAADRSTLSAAEGNKRSLPAAGPKAIPWPEGAHRPSCTCRGLSWPHSLPSQPFHSLFDSFQSAYHLSLLVLVHYWSCASISLRWRLPPTMGCNPKQLDFQKRSRVPQSVAPTYRAITLSGMACLSSATSEGCCGDGPSPDYNSPMQCTGDYRLGLFPLHSLLLGTPGLFPFLIINMFELSGSPHLT